MPLIGDPDVLRWLRNRTRAPLGAHPSGTVWIWAPYWGTPRHHWTWYLPNRNRDHSRRRDSGPHGNISGWWYNMGSSCNSRARRWGHHSRGLFYMMDILMISELLEALRIKFLRNFRETYRLPYRNISFFYGIWWFAVELHVQSVHIGGIYSAIGGWYNWTAIHICLI